MAVDLSGVWVRVEILYNNGHNGTTAITFTPGLSIEAVEELLRAAADGLRKSPPGSPSYEAAVDDELQRMLDRGD